MERIKEIEAELLPLRKEIKRLEMARSKLLAERREIIKTNNNNRPAQSAIKEALEWDDRMEKRLTYFALWARWMNGERVVDLARERGVSSSRIRDLIWKYQWMMSQPRWQRAFKEDRFDYVSFNRPLEVGADKQAREATNG